MASVLRYKVFTMLRNIPRTCFFLKTKNLSVVRPAAKAVPMDGLKNYGQMSLKQCLLLLEKKIQDKGRLTGFDLEFIVKSIQNKGNLESNQILFLVKCCGSIAANEPPASRMAYAQKVWDSVKASGAELDISHYNVFLKIQIENEELISPFEYLRTIEDEGLVPNRITYQYLLTYCCLKGDLGKATKILEEMNSKKFPLNENIFNALVMGHCVAGDVTSAEGVLNIMKEKDVFITSITYSMFLCGLAMSGNIEKMKSLMEECSKQNIELPGSRLMDIVYYLFINGHSDYAVEILSSLWHPRYQRDLFTLQYRLIHKKHFEDYISTLKFLTKAEGTMDKLRLALRYLGNKEDFESILKFQEACDKKGVGADVMKYILYYSIMANDIGKSFEIIEYLHKSGHQIKESYFTPLIVKAANKNVEDLFRILNVMFYRYNCEVSCEFLCRHVFNNLDLKEKQMTYFLEGIFQYLPPALVFNAFMKSCLFKKEINKLGIMWNTRRSSFKLYEDTISAMVKYLKDGNDPEDIANIMVKWVEEKREVNLESSESDHADSAQKDIKETIHKLASKIYHNCSDDIAQNFLQVAEKRNLPMYAEEFHLIAQNKQQTPQSSTSTEESGAANVEEQTVTEQSDKTISGGGSNLLQQLFELKQAGNVSELEKLLDENEELQTQLGFRTIVRAMKVLNENDLVMKYLKKYYEKFSQSDGGLSLNFFLEAEMLNRGMLKEAITLIEKRNYIKRGANVVLTENLIPVLEKLNRDDLKEILNIPSSSPYKLIPLFKIFEILTKRGLEETGIKILGMLEVNDIKRHAALWTLTSSLFNKKNFELMEELIKFTEGHPARKEFVFELILLYACSGNIAKGREFLNSEQVRPQRITMSFIKFIKSIEEREQAKVVENVIAIVKGYESFPLLYFYNYLMKRYDIDSVSPEKALDLWLQLQEDNVQPSSTFLITLAQILRRNGREVPFVVPSFQIAIPESLPLEIQNALRHTKNRSNVNAVERLILKNKLKRTHIELLLKQNPKISQEMKDVYEHLLSLLEWKTAYDDGVLVSHLKKVIESTGPGRKDKDIPVQFLVHLLVSIKHKMSISSSRVVLWAYLQNRPEFGPLLEILDPTVQELIQNESTLLEIVTVLAEEQLTENVKEIVASLLSRNMFNSYDYIKKTAEDILGKEVLRTQEKKISEPDENETAFRSVLESKFEGHNIPDSETPEETLKVSNSSENPEVVSDRTSGTGPNV